MTFILGDYARRQVYIQTELRVGYRTRRAMTRLATRSALPPTRSASWPGVRPRTWCRSGSLAGRARHGAGSQLTTRDLRPLSDCSFADGVGPIPSGGCRRTCESQGRPVGCRRHPGRGYARCRPRGTSGPPLALGSTASRAAENSSRSVRAPATSAPSACTRARSPASEV